MDIGTFPIPACSNAPTRAMGGRSTGNFVRCPNCAHQRLPGMVLFGNSFSDLYWALGLQRYFCFIRRAREPVSRFKTFYDTMPADTKYFIFEYYEPWSPTTRRTV